MKRGRQAGGLLALLLHVVFRSGLFIAVLGATAFSHAFAADRAALVAAEERGFARLIISFPEQTLLPAYEASITAGVLRLTFPQGVNVSVDDVPGALPDYISIARRDPDGTALRFALKQAVTINSMEAGEKLFVDLLPQSWTGLPPSLPKDVVRELSRRADAALRRVQELEAESEQVVPEVLLRLGQHPTFSRLVFDWNMPFESAFVRNGNIVQVIFNRAAELDVARLSVDPPKGVLGATSFVEGDELFFRMRVDPQSQVRAFKEGASYVVDVTPAQQGELDPLNEQFAEALSSGNAPPAGAEDLIVSLGEELPAATQAALQPDPLYVQQQAPPPAPANTISQNTAPQAKTPTEVPVKGAQAQRIERTKAEKPQLSLAPVHAIGGLPVQARPVKKTAVPAALQVAKAPPMSLLPEEVSSQRTPASSSPEPVLVSQKAAEPRPSVRPTLSRQQGPAPEPNNTTRILREPQLQIQAGRATANDSVLAPNERRSGPDEAGAGDVPALPSERIVKRDQSRLPTDEQMPANGHMSEEEQGQLRDAVAPFVAVVPHQKPAGEPVLAPHASAELRDDPVHEVLQEAPLMQGDEIGALVANLNRQTGLTGEDQELQVNDGVEPLATIAESEVLPEDAASKRISAETMPPQPVIGSGLVHVDARRIDDVARLEFTFDEPVSSAVFQRGNRLWLAFDSDKELHIGTGLRILDEYATGAVMDRQGELALMLLELSDTALASLETNGNNWVLTVSSRVLASSQALPVERVGLPEGGTGLRIGLDKVGHVHKLLDPVVGDEVMMITSYPPVRAVTRPQDFAQVSFLKALNGIALLPKVDGIEPLIGESEVVLGRAGGLALSSTSAGFLLAQEGEESVEAADAVGLSLLDEQTHKDFLGKLRQFEGAIAAADEAQLQGLRQELAHFYLSQGFAHEALGMMQLIEQQNSAIRKEPKYALMMGAAQYMADRPEEALRYLRAEELGDHPEAAVWRLLAQRAKENWPAVYQEIPLAEEGVRGYPDAVRNDVWLAIAGAQMELGNYGAAIGRLSAIEPENLSLAQLRTYDYLRARTAEASGQLVEALDGYEEIVRSSDGPLAAESQLRATLLRFRDGSTNAIDTIAELEGLAATWRGDRTELRTLDALAQMNVSSGNYRQAFDAMGQALESDPDSEITRELQAKMQKVFADIFLRGGNSGLDPVASLALFYDFRELVPPGREGDVMVRRLANRLVDMDLLDQAAAILQHQIDHRLRGAAKAQIAADLAVVHLLNRKPEQALRVLSQTRQGQLPDVLLHQRNIVEGSALAESGRPDLAIELVRNMRGDDVDRLRADILWQAKSWREAGEQLEAMHGTRWQEAAPLSDQEQIDVLRAAVAYTMAGEQLSLGRLQQKYAEKMQGGERAKDFEVVTRPIEERGVEFLQVVNKVSGESNLNAFLQEYRRRYLAETAWQSSADAPIDPDGTDLQLGEPEGNSNKADTGS